MSSNSTTENARDFVNGDATSIPRGSILQVTGVDEVGKQTAQDQHNVGISMTGNTFAAGAIVGAPAGSPVKVATGGCVLVLREKGAQGAASPAIPPNTIVGPGATNFDRCAALVSGAYPIGVVIDGDVTLRTNVGTGVVPFVDLEYYALVRLSLGDVPLP